MSSGNGKIVGFRVEARLAFGNAFSPPPPAVGYTTITESWKRIGFTHSGPVGIRNDIHNALAQQNGVLTYAAAMALMTWVASHHSNVEFRLVKVEFTYSYSEEEVGVGEPQRFGYGTARDVEFSEREDTP